MKDNIEDRIRRLEVAIYYAQENLRFNKYSVGGNTVKDEVNIKRLNDILEELKNKNPEYFI